MRLSSHLARRPKCVAVARAAANKAEDTSAQGVDRGAALNIFQDAMKATVVRDLSDFRFGRGSNIVSGSAVDRFKESAADWLAASERSLVEALKPHVSPSSGIDVAELIHSRLDIFNGINTAKLEKKAAVELYGRRYIEPKQRLMPGSMTDAVWDFPIVEQLQALIAYDRSAAMQILHSSASYCAGGFRNDSVIADIKDGLIFRKHPMLGERSRPLLCGITAGEAVKTAWKLYYDDVEVVNPLGVARGMHAIGAIYISLINLDPASRNRLENTFLVTIAKASVIKKYGMAAVLAGPDPLNSSLSAQMKALNAGAVLNYPANGAFGGLEPRTTYGWVLLMSGDYPAMAKLVGTAQSVAAKKPCRHCNWDRKADDSFARSSFLPRAGLPDKWSLRCEQSLELALANANQLRCESARVAKLRSEGYFSSTFVFHSSWLPCLPDPYACTPQDGMHALFSSGIANSEAAEMLYVFISVHRDFTVEMLNDRIDEYDWPSGERPPDIHESVRIGASGGVPAAGAHLRLTGSQTLHFTLHSVQLLEPLIKTTSSPAWASWKALARVVKLYVASSFTEASVIELDIAIANHMSLYKLVPQYKGRLRPKHHFLTHTAVDILNFGAPRNFWCFGYEAKNQEVKQAVAASNFKNPIKSAAFTLAMQSAKSLMDRSCT